MSKIKVLNLYAGIGGNRKLWENVEVTAVENNQEIADIYKHFFPQDNVVIADAHQYLLDHFKEFDFIWSSPPCPSHSRMRTLKNNCDECVKLYPDMGLWQEIIFLKHFCKTKWVVENVISYYEPLIKPYKSGDHYFWSNFIINNTKINRKNMRRGSVPIEEHEKDRLKVSDLNISKNMKQIILNNCVLPKLGLHVFECAFRKKQSTLSDTSIPPAPKGSGILEGVL